MKRKGKEIEIKEKEIAKSRKKILKWKQQHERKTKYLSTIKWGKGFYSILYHSSWNSMIS